jgi:hypothetical protein
MDAKVESMPDAITFPAYPHPMIRRRSGVLPGIILAWRPLKRAVNSLSELRLV